MMQKMILEMMMVQMMMDQWMVREEDDSDDDEDDDDCEDDLCQGRGMSLSSSSSSSSISSSSCSCQCDPSWPVFREDRQVCVDSLHECEMADFVTGSSSEKIPFVFLPLAGQLVYPSARILIPSGSSEGSVSPICVLSNIQIMSSQGWEDIGNLTGQHSA